MSSKYFKPGAKYVQNENQSEDEDSDYSQDIERLQTILKQNQEIDTLPTNKTQKKNYQQQIKDQIQTSTNEFYSKLEKELQLTIEQNKLLTRQLQQAQEEARVCKQQMTSQSEYNNHKKLQNEFLSKQFDQLNQEQSEVLKKCQEQIMLLQNQVDQKDLELRQQREMMDNRVQQLTKASVTQEKNWDRVIDLEKQLRLKDEEIFKLQHFSTNLNNQNHDLILEKKAEGTFMVEVEHLKADVKRLVQMLRTTEEYKEFADFADDNGRSIRFLKDIKKITDLDVQITGGYPSNKILRPCIEEEIIDEKLLWVPEEAFKFAHDFRLKYNGELTEVLIEDLLFELNKIWSKREQAQLRRVRAQCGFETNALRRQIQINPKFNEFQANSTINRLKNQLKMAYKENRDAFNERARRCPEGIKYVSETMKLNNDVQKYKKNSEQVNQLLKEKLNNIEKYQQVERNDKQIFLEGANWMASNIQGESHNLLNNLGNIKQYYNDSCQVYQDDGNKEVAAKNLLDNMEQEIQNFQQKVQNIKNNTEKQMIDSSDHLKYQTQKIKSTTQQAKTLKNSIQKGINKTQKI